MGLVSSELVLLFWALTRRETQVRGPLRVVRWPGRARILIALFSFVSIPPVVLPQILPLKILQNGAKLTLLSVSLPKPPTHAVLALLVLVVACCPIFQ